MPIRAVAQPANIAAGIVVSKQGLILVILDELVKALSQSSDYDGEVLQEVD